MENLVKTLKSESKQTFESDGKIVFMKKLVKTLKINKLLISWGKLKLSEKFVKTLKINKLLLFS